MAKSVFALSLVLLAIYASARAQDQSPLYCDYGQFTCLSMDDPYNATCISFTYVCDGIDNCYNGTDEEFCGVCPTGTIQCPLANTTVCINNTQACDGTEDCPNGQDETVNACGCIDPDEVPVCAGSNEFRYCINRMSLCDGVQDCTYGEDESFPHCPESCPPELSCFGDGTSCFEVYQLCDGVFNCENAFDEGNCSTPEPEPPFCPYGLYNCPDGIGGRSCINYTRVCDGVYDCYNSTDESMCEGCPVGSILCPNSSTCISNTAACDGVEDCPDGCDEGVGACGCIIEGEVPVCRDEYGDPYCINETLVCNGVPDCTYGEDESFPYCPENVTTTPPTPSFCPYGMYSCDRGGCSLGDSCCLNYTDVCNGVQDCLSYTDEMEDICGNCSIDMVMCPNSSMCINNTLLCDGYNHCPYGADESVAVCGCYEDGFYPVCSDLNGEPYCLHGSLICDGKSDCMYGEDESELYNCPTRPPITTEPPTEGRCPNGYFGCPPNYECVPTNYLCDGIPQCEGGFDEYLCGNCSLGEIMCPDTDICINASSACDGIYDCPNYGEEDGSLCNIPQPPQFECPSGTVACGFDFTNCIPPEAICDGINDCGTDLAVDEVPGFWDLFGQGVSCQVNGTGPRLVVGLIAPPFETPGPVPILEGFPIFFCIARGGFSSRDEFNFTLNVTPGSAELNVDFADVSGTTYFGPDDSIACFNVTIYDDGIFEGDENFTLSADIDANVEYDFIGPMTVEFVIIDNIAPTTDGPTPGPIRCPFGQFSCYLLSANTPSCVSNTYLCDGTVDCLDETDELYCGGNCSLNQYLCPGAFDYCIDNAYVCDEIYHCPNGTDENEICYILQVPTEVPTTVPGPIRCPDGYFGCPPDYPCAPTNYLCDGTPQCVGGFDELLCGICPVGQIMCFNSSECINSTDVCNGVYDCPDYQDEESICYESPLPPTEVPTPGPTRCPFGYFNCYVDENVSSCLPNTDLCDGESECYDGTDELYCGGNCSLNEYQCPGTDYCINNTYVCDQIYHCPNGTDEHEICYFPQPPEPVCPPGSIPCGFDFTSCFTPMEACDGVNDCGDELALDEVEGFVTLGGLSCPVTSEGDELVIGLLAPPFNGTVLIPEGAIVFFCVVRAGFSSRDPFNVTLTVAGNGAEPNVDFADVSGTTYFGPDDTIFCYNITIYEDGVIENIEGFYITAVIEANVDYTTVGSLTADFEILDFDGAGVEFEPAVNVTEGDYVDICVTVTDLGNGLERNVSFDVQVLSNSTDFYLDTPYITIPEDSYEGQTICFTVGRAVDDLFIEETETVYLFLRPRNFTDQANFTFIEVTIFDNDYVEFMFENSTEIQVDEGPFQLSVCLVTSTNLTEYYRRFRPIVIQFSVTEVTATESEDFSYSFGSTVHYVDRYTNTDICLLLDGLDDMYIEDSEYLFVTVSITEPGFLEGDQQVNITILDDEVAEFMTNFEPEIYTSESNWTGPDPMSPFQFCVTPSDVTRDYLRRDVNFVFNILTYPTSPINEAELDRDFVEYGIGEQTYYYGQNDYVCVTVEIIDDRIIEEEYELFAITVSVGNPYDTLNGYTATNITILDDDYIYVALVAPESVPEEVGSFNVYVILYDTQEGLDRDVTVTVNLQEYEPLEMLRRKRSIPADEFFPLGNQTVTFYAGSGTGSNQSITIYVLDEPYIEGDEVVISEIVQTDEPYRPDGDIYVYTYVVDNDGVSLLLSTDSVMLLESVGEVTVTVYILTTATRFRDVVVDVEVVLVSADSNDIGDYAQQLIFGPSNDSLVVTIPITIDNVVGQDEVFEILFTPENPLDTFVNGSNVTTVTVDESAMVGFTQATIQTMEGAVSIDVCVYHANHTLEADLQVELQLMDGDAVFGEDYRFNGTDSITYTLTFPTGSTETRRCVEVLILDDDVTENAEYFSISLTPLDSADTVGIKNVTVTINDNDGVSFEAENIEVNETDSNQTVSLCVTMNPTAAGLARSASVSYDSQTLTFGPTLTSVTQCFNYTVVGDNFVEDTEFDTLILTTGYDIDTANRPVVTIFDDDSATIAFNQAEISVNESVGQVEVCVNLLSAEDDLFRDVPFTVTYGDGMTAEGVLSEVGEQRCFNFTIEDDDVIEDTENISFYLTAGNGNDLIQVDTFVITVNDNDGATISFSLNDFTVSESVGEVEVCVILEEVKDGLSRHVPFTVTYEDAEPVQSLFEPGSEPGIEHCFNYTVTNDNIIEGSEEILFYLAADNGNDFVEVFEFIIVVVDNDGANITLVEVATVTESNRDFTVQIGVTVEGMIQRNVTFEVFVEAETSDVFIADGELTVDTNGTYYVELTVVGDNIVEDTEQFNISVRAVNEYDRVGGSVVLTVDDDDGALISIEPVGTILEADEDFRVEIPVTVDGIIERDATFTVSIDAANVSDAFIADGELTVTINGTYYVNLTVVGDNIIEDIEQYNIEVTVVNQLDQVGDLAVITVDDDDVATIEIIPQFESEISESITVLQVCAELSDIGEGLERTVEAQIAQENDEVSPEIESITFPSGSSLGTRLCVNFTREDDDYVEYIGGILFYFGSPQDNVSINMFEVTVLDDDGVTMQLEYTERYLLEGSSDNSITEVCLILTSDPSLIRRTVQATAEVVDYSDNVNLTTFMYTMTAYLAEDGRACFTLSIEDDNEYLLDFRFVELMFNFTYPTDMIDEPYIVVVTIEDDDSPLVKYKNYVPFIAVTDTSDGVSLYELGDTDDGCSSQIFMNSGLPFGTTSETSLRVCANGAISIGTGHFNFFSPSRFPGFFPVSDTNVIAPFWNDHDPSGPFSNVWYKVYTANFGSIPRQYLADVSSYVQCNSDATSFSGNWMLVVEWDTVPPFPIRFDNEIVNTYQAIVITDGVLTFALYTYKCGELRWSAGPASNTHAVIGYNIGPNNRRFESPLEPFFNHPLSGFQDISSIACANYPLRIPFSNLLYLVGNDSGADQLAIAECVKRADQDNLLFAQAGSFNFGPFPGGAYDQPCPCSVFQAERDFNYFYASYYLAFLTGDESFYNRACFLQSFPPSPFVPGQGVQLCCYSTSFFDFGALLDGSFGVEGSSLLRFHPLYDPDQYLEYDYRFKQSCCETSGVCEFYTQVRPSDNCLFYSPPIRAWCWGDPHITTLDGGTFTFNGWGEYTLLDFTLEPTSFLLQGRTQPVNGSTATQLVAFAFAMIRTLPVEIGLKSNDSNEMIVRFNGTDISANVTNVNDTYTTSNLRITRDDVNSLTATFPNGVGVTVTASFSMLSFVLIVPERFRNITEGMMGNYNGDPMDDVRFRNGTMLSANVSDRVIHEVGQSWEIDAEDSLFTYSEGMSAADFSHPDHIPVFLDEVIANASAEVLEACGEDAKCMFDASQTGNIEIGLETMNTNAQNEDDQTQATNNPPRIMGPTTLRLDLGVEAILVMNVSDDKNMFNFTVVDGLPPGATLTPVGMDGFTEYTFTWTMDTVMNRSLMFEASDELNARSVLNVQVRVCACQNNGTCTIEGIVGTSADFIVLNCECNGAYMGRLCEDDVDGCMEFMCFQGVECMDVPAPGIGATCGPCPEGYVGDGEKCDDFNECVNGTHSCSDICNNLEGTFECLCLNGYELLNTTHCRDINECDMLNGGCHQQCTNSDGTFTCSCFEGYELSDNNMTCNVLANATCSNDTSCTQNCVRLFGVETCSCNPGYELAADNQTCNNVDECLTDNPCQVCTDTEGSFQCSCMDGYNLLADNVTCEAINECIEAALNGTVLCTPPMFCVDLAPDMGMYRCDCPGGTELIGEMCIPITTAPPTTMAPPTGTVPEQYEEDAVIITIPGLTVAQFGADARLQFREAAAEAVNTFCALNDCINPSRKRQAFMNVTEADIVMNNVRDVDGVLTFDMYVLRDMTVAIPASAVESAVESNPQVFIDVGLAAPMVEPLLQPTTEPTAQPLPGLTDEQIIGIAIGCALGAIILLLLIVIITVLCCLRSRSKRGSHDFSYGLEYDNPVADDEVIEPITLKNTEKDDIPQASGAEPNIYVNPHGDEEEETEPRPKEMTEEKKPTFSEGDKRSEDRSIQSLILNFGDDGASEHSAEKEELTTL